MKNNKNGEILIVSVSRNSLNIGSFSSGISGECKTYILTPVQPIYIIIAPNAVIVNPILLLLLMIHLCYKLVL